MESMKKLQRKIYKNLRLMTEELQAKNGFCRIDPIALPRTLNGLRDGKPVEVKVGICLEGKPIFKVVEGGVTGHESWYLESLIQGGIMDADPGKMFWANAGGMGWSALTLNTGDIQRYIKDFMDISGGTD